MGLDRGRLWRHFASRTFSENGCIFVRIPCFCVFLMFSCFFDLTCTFQVPRLSFTCLLYVKDLDLYPKCPPCCDLGRKCPFLWSVSMSVVKSSWLKLKSASNFHVPKSNNNNNNNNNNTHNKKPIKSMNQDKNTTTFRKSTGG